MDRSSGILLPVSALPGPCGIGDLGADARDFIDFLAAAGQRYWQILPLNPPDGAHSPYLSASTFAGSTDLLSPEPFLARGALTAGEVRAIDWGADPMRVDYDRVYAGRTALWDAAFAREKASAAPALRAALAGKLSCLTGNSGVGKSSLLNCVSPELQLPVGEVSEKLGRGRHTTRHIELYALAPDTFVADTPGFSAFDTERMELVHKEQLQYAFPEFAPYLGHCQFPDCAHRKEPGCAVRKALADGQIGQTRYDSYERLYEMASQIKEWELK